MFYQPENGHGLPHDPINALVIPRPIGWVSSIDASGVSNLAPFALFNLVTYAPPHVMFAPTGTSPGRPKGQPKDSLTNVRETGEFVINMATWELRDKVWLSSIPAPPGVSEFDITGLTPIPSRLVKPPRVKESPCHLECRVAQILELAHTDPEVTNYVVIGRVVGIHISDDVLVDGIVDYTKIAPMARLGYTDYTRVTEVHTKPFPKWPPS